MARIALFTSVLLSLTAVGVSQQQQKPPPKPPTRSPQSQTTRAPVELFLSGRVVMADGSDVPQDTQVYLVCDGSIRRQTHTIDGDFSFSLGSGPSTNVMDASVSGSETGIFGGQTSLGSANPTLTRRLETGSSLKRVNLHGCSIQASAPGYQSSVLHLGSRSALDRPHIGDLFLQPLTRADSATVSATRLAAPDDAVKAFEKAVTQFGEKDFKKAAKEAQKAIDIYPEYAEAWQLLGAARTFLNDSRGATEAFEQAVKADPAFLPPVVALSRVHVKAGRFAKAAELSGQVIAAAPTLYDAYYIHSLSHYNLGNLEVALQSVEQYLARPDSISPTAHLLMGFVRAERREFLEAASAFESYLRQVPDGDASQHARQQLAQWRQQGLIPD